MNSQVTYKARDFFGARVDDRFSRMTELQAVYHDPLLLCAVGSVLLVTLIVFHLSQLMIMSC